MASVQRDNTYNGPQMEFKFPSQDNLTPVDEHSVPSTMHPDTLSTSAPLVSKAHDDHHKHEQEPPVQCYYEYAMSNSGSQVACSIAGSSGFGSEPYTMPDSSVMNFSFEESEHPSIPTQSNISYQITDNSNSPHEQLVASEALQRGPTVIRYSGSTRQGTRQSAIQQPNQRSPSIKRVPQIARTRSIKRTASVRSENASLYERSSLTRSGAVKYKVGWLTRLRNLASQLKNKMKCWRVITLKKLFKFNRRSAKKGRSRIISLPLERAQSISELRMAIDDQDNINTKIQYNIGAQLPVAPIYRTVSNIMDPDDVEPSKQSRGPPPLPRHRIASSVIMQRHIDAQLKSDSRRHGEVTTSVLLEPMDEQHQLLQQQLKEHEILKLEEEEQNCYPSHPVTVCDEESIAGLEQDEMKVFELEEEVEDESDEDEDERELLFRQYWSHYLRKAVAERIESKLEMYTLSQIPAPSIPVQSSEDATSTQSLSDFEMRDDDDVQSTASTSASSAAFSSSEYSMTGSGSSEYDSVVGQHAQYISSEELLRYQEEYINRLKNSGVKRSSTLPMRYDTLGSSDHIMTAAGGYAVNHARFLSVGITM